MCFPACPGWRATKTHLKTRGVENKRFRSRPLNVELGGLNRQKQAKKSGGNEENIQQNKMYFFLQNMYKKKKKYCKLIFLVKFTISSSFLPL